MIPLFSLGWRFVRYATGLFIFVLLIGFLLVFNLKRPELPDTSLGMLEGRTYYETLKSFSASPTGTPVQVVLSPQETSYLMEKYQPDVTRYGFELTDVHLEATGDQSQLRTVFKGPGGIYLQITAVGTARYRDGEWRLDIDSLSVGNLPISWVMSSTRRPNWPSTFAGGQIEIKSGRLDGRGLKATVVNRGLELDLSFDLLDRIG